VLLLQDRWWEGTFTCTLLPPDIAIIFCTILDNMTMKDYFSILKSSVMPQCPAGLLIIVQPNTYIEKTEHFWTSLHLVKERRQLNKGYNVQEVWEIQPSFVGDYCVVSGLCSKPNWQDFPSNQSVIKALVKCKTKQSHMRTFSASRHPHLFPGELLSITEQDTLFEDLVKEHVDHMEQPKLLKNLFTKSKTTSSLAIVEMQLGPVELMAVRTTRSELMMR
jgi:hypothetical protein